MNTNEKEAVYKAADWLMAYTPQNIQKGFSGRLTPKELKLVLFARDWWAMALRENADHCW